MQIIERDVEPTHAKVFLEQAERPQNLEVVVLLPAHIDVFVQDVT